MSHRDADTARHLEHREPRVHAATERQGLRVRLRLGAAQDRGRNGLTGQPGRPLLSARRRRRSVTPTSGAVRLVIYAAPHARRHLMRRWSLPLLALVLVLALAPGADAQPKDTLTIALPSHAPTLDPHMHFERVGVLVKIGRASCRDRVMCAEIA